MILKRGILCFALAGLCSLAAAACTFRPENTNVPAPDPVRVQDPAAEQSPESARIYTVEYRLNGQLLGAETVEEGRLPAAAYAPEGLRLIGWTDESGLAADPASVPVYGNAVYHAVTRPLLRQTDILFADERGFLRPEETFSRADAARAVRALTDDAAVQSFLAVWDAAPEDALTMGELEELLTSLFDPREAASVMDAFTVPEDASVTRAQAAFCLARLMELPARDDRYYPDAGPRNWAYAELTAVSAPGSLDRQTLMDKTLDGFLWFDGYLYYLDEGGYFLSDEIRDGLYYDVRGQYTSGNEELDAYVAQTIKQYMVPGGNRRDQLKAMYNHVKNDLNYLVRNYYPSGATGWEIEEALTMYRTGRGNCYCYTGTFWSLARGLGYNAVAYSGSIGLENQPHAWTEILLDGKVYICDPEIEMNYWYLAYLNGDNSMFTDNFMMPRENSLNWNYQAKGRS